MIRLDNVTKKYGSETVAVRDATFDVAKGDFVFLVGPSGSGKSTILRLINRQEVADRGDVWVAGRNVNEMPDSRVPYLRRSMGNVFQDYKLLMNKTVFENVAFALEVIGKPRHMIARQVPIVLDLVGLAGKEDRFPNQLSGGERQRVAIARALVASPDLVICDEITSALDVSVQAAIVDLLEELRRDLGLTLLFVTHNLPLVRSIADRLAVLSGGAVVETGPAEEVIAAPRHSYTRELLADSPAPDYA